MYGESLDLQMFFSLCLSFLFDSRYDLNAETQQRCPSKVWKSQKLVSSLAYPVPAKVLYTLIMMSIMI